MRAKSSSSGRLGARASEKAWSRRKHRPQRCGSRCRRGSHRVRPGVVERPVAISHDSQGQGPFADEFFLIRRQILLGNFPAYVGPPTMTGRLPKSTDPFAFFRQIQGNGPARYLKEPRRFGSSLTDEAFRIACRAEINSIHVLDVHKNQPQLHKTRCIISFPYYIPKKDCRTKFFTLCEVLV